MICYYSLIEWSRVLTDMLESPRVLTVPDGYGLQSVAYNIAPKLPLKALKPGIDLVSSWMKVISSICLQNREF